MRVLEAGDRDGGGMLLRMLLDRLPGRCIRYPSSRRGLLGCQLGRFVGCRDTTRVNLADAQPLARRFRLDRRRAVGERHIDCPHRGAVRSVTPEESWRSDLRWEDRSIRGIVNGDCGKLKSTSALRGRGARGQRACRLPGKHLTGHACAVLQRTQNQTKCDGSYTPDPQTSCSQSFHGIPVIRLEDGLSTSSNHHSRGSSNIWILAVTNRTAYMRRRVRGCISRVPYGAAQNVGQQNITDSLSSGNFYCSLLQPV